MKSILLITAILFTFNTTKAQSLFSSETDVMQYMEGKIFINDDNGLKISYGFISNLNTYGITVKNKNNAIFYYINCNIDPLDYSADIYGMSTQDGGNFGFRVFKNRLVIGYGEEGAKTFYLKQ